MRTGSPWPRSRPRLRYRLSSVPARVRLRFPRARLRAATIRSRECVSVSRQALEKEEATRTQGVRRRLEIARVKRSRQA